MSDAVLAQMVWAIVGFLALALLAGVAVAAIASSRGRAADAVRRETERTEREAARHRDERETEERRLERVNARNAAVAGLVAAPGVERLAIQDGAYRADIQIAAPVPSGAGLPTCAGHGNGGNGHVTFRHTRHGGVTEWCTGHGAGATAGQAAEPAGVTFNISGGNAHAGTFPTENGRQGDGQAPISGARQMIAWPPGPTLPPTGHWDSRVAAYGRRPEDRPEPARTHRGEEQPEPRRREPAEPAVETRARREPMMDCTAVRRAILAASQAVRAGEVIDGFRKGRVIRAFDHARSCTACKIAPEIVALREELGGRMSLGALLEEAARSTRPADEPSTPQEPAT